MKSIYLDDSASTRVYPEVVKAMLPYFVEEYGNPSAAYERGERARKAIQDAREILARKINCKPWEIIFTSGVTEANNMAFFGMAHAHRDKKKIIISAIEHASIVEICNNLEKQGYKIVRIPVNTQGILDYNKLEQEIDRNTLLVSVMHVNNILGTIQNIDKIGALCYHKSVMFHTDASQSFAKLPIDVKSANVDMLSASAHKIGGPKGVGFLYIKDGLKIEPIIFGGGQERGLRGGTENVPGIVGFAKACEITSKKNRSIVEKNRDLFMKELEGIEGKVNGSRKSSERVYNNVHVSFAGVDAGNLVSYLSHKGIYISTGSACESKKEKEDHVLKAIGLNEKEINGSIRITLNDAITKSDILKVIEEIKKGLKISKRY